MRGQRIVAVITKLPVALSLAFLFNACAINRNIEVSNTHLVSNVSGMSKAKKVQWAKVSPGFNFADYKSVYIPRSGWRAKPRAHRSARRLLMTSGSVFCVSLGRNTR